MTSKMFTFGVIVFIIGAFAFIISLFCLIIGKIMSVNVKGTAIMTLVCVVITAVGIVCMRPISITHGNPQTNTFEITQTAQYEYGNVVSPEIEKQDTIDDTAYNAYAFDDNKDETISAIDAIGDVEVDKHFFTVTITVPKDFIGETTQTELDSIAKERGYKSATLNADGSVTYVMTKAQHNDLMESVTDSINDGIKDMITSPDYPTIIDIRANSDYTNFIVVTNSTEISIMDSLVALALYADGGMYGIFNGKRVDNVHIDYVNADSGEIIGTANSSDMSY